ncbi:MULTISPECIES: antirestriction protein [Burkholderia]|uniref:Antirestriction protein n=1 Tax=Burkholderia contaminans TaxID=488447 RepID=A0ABD7YG56_9BURK|nr:MULTISPECIES: antirestriction protein [Burkholderia]MCA7912080.1 antirestriction protein [Burkholderia contaminans]WFN24051.1 antirestriction protein [Burkholderia contaminans]
MEENVIEIRSELVVEEQRMHFLPHYFGARYLHGEAFVYDWARRLCSTYNGGMWHFFRLSNGAFYLAPEIAAPVSVRWNLNSYEGSMGAEAFGIVVTLYALCHMAETFGDERFIDHYHALRAFAVQHPEQREIFRAID